MSIPLNFYFDLNKQVTNVRELSPNIFLGFLNVGISSSFVVPDTRQEWAVLFNYNSNNAAPTCLVSFSVPTVPVADSVVASNAEFNPKALVVKGGQSVFVSNIGSDQLFFTASCYTLNSTKPA